MRSETIEYNEQTHEFRFRPMTWEMFMAVEIEAEKWRNSHEGATDAHLKTVRFFKAAALATVEVDGVPIRNGDLSAVPLGLQAVIGARIYTLALIGEDEQKNSLRPSGPHET